MKMQSVVTLLLMLSLFSLITTKYTSGESLYEMTKLSSVNPEPHNCSIFPCEFYIWGSQATKPETAALTCLGYVGALGALGPLGPLGPLGSNTYDPTAIFKLFVDWNAIRRYIMVNGPLNHPEGPMSKYGPLGESYFTVMPRINDFTKHMMQFGIWSILGPIGPLGALGGLGPLGPIGSHGYKRNSSGDYVNTNDEIVTTAEAIWESSKKIKWPLFEHYSFQRSQELSKEKKLDTSFMTSTTVALSPDSYVVQSSENQIISIVIVPNLMNFQFVVEVLNSNRKVIASSTTAKMINWVQFQGNSNSEYTIRVKSHPINCFTSIGCMGLYTMHVVGSTKQMLRSSPIQYTGQYILN
eukprot:gene6030-10032_t